MVHILEFQQFSDFPKPFRGNFHMLASVSKVPKFEERGKVPSYYQIITFRRYS